MENEKAKKENIGLVLEGGGMRGIFTAGVLDLFLEKNVEVDNCIGVSAGALLGVNYLSKQEKRGFEAIADHIQKREYGSFYNLIKTGNYFETQYSYHDIPEKYNPFDNNMFKNSPIKFQAVITNCETGQPEYPEIKDAITDIDILRASASLPFLSKMVKLGDKKYLDGGVADSIPLKYSIKKGNKKNIVVLTRDRSYRKTQSKLGVISKVKYRKYPKFVELMKTRYTRYNKTLEYIYDLEKRGEIFVIQPQVPLTLGRIEKNREKLEEVYKIGYNEARKRYNSLLEYLKK